jgi:hypothetical protein
MIADMSSASDNKSRKGPLFWVLTGGALFLVLLFGGLVLTAYIAGSDLEKRAGEAATGDKDLDRILPLVLADPSNEILEKNVEKHSVRFRDKDGNEFIESFDPDTNQVKRIAVPKDPAKAPGK